MSRIKRTEHPSAQHLRAQAASIRVLAAAVKSPALLTRLEEMRAEYLGRAGSYPAEWRDVAGFNQDVLHVTVAEATAVRDQIRALLASYRRLDPADRPPDAHRVHTLVDLLPWFDPGELQ